MTWESEAARMQEELAAMHQLRENALRGCRVLIQTSARCIRHVHRRDREGALALLAEARSVSADLRSTLAGHPELLYAGYVQDAEKEMVEAAAVLAWVGDRGEVPSRESLGVGVATYLNGLGEAASEVRRYVLDEMRSGRLDESERLLRLMESVYDELVTFDYPDALTGGLRRTCDALRAVVERTRSDLTMTIVQHELMAELRKRPYT